MYFILMLEIMLTLKKYKCYTFDENDKDYIDFTSGIAVCSVGWK